MKKNSEVRVLIITRTQKLNSGWGRYSAETIKLIREAGFSVSVVTEDETGDLTISPKRSLFHLVVSVLKIRWQARMVDVVHAYDGWPYGWYGYLAVIGTTKKLLINGVGTYSVAPLHQSIKSFLVKRAYRRAAAIFCISRYVKQKIDEVVSVHTEVVHLGVTHLDQPVGNILYNQFSLPPEAYPVILTVGEIKRRKGQLETWRALLTLKAEYPKLLYVLVGQSTPDDNYRQQIEVLAREAGAENNLKILTEIKSDQDLAFLYQRADLLVLRSQTDQKHYHFEGFGLVILEANQFGVPAVGSKDSGIEDAIVPGVNGYLIDQVNDQEFLLAVRKILARPKSDWLTGCQSVAADFQWAKTVDAYIAKYIN